jgi:RNA polymerase sigma-70 factor, ECF subfamily
VVAETFLVAWRRLDRVPADSPLPWLLAIARNIVASQRRASSRRDALYLRLRESVGDQAADALSVEPPTGAVAAALARLGEKDREALTLIGWDGLRPREAAAVVGEIPSAFYVRLHRAKRRLRRLLDEPPERSSDAPAPHVLEAKEPIP